MGSPKHGSKRWLRKVLTSDAQASGLGELHAGTIWAGPEAERQVLVCSPLNLLLARAPASCRRTSRIPAPRTRSLLVFNRFNR